MTEGTTTVWDELKELELLIERGGNGHGHKPPVAESATAAAVAEVAAEAAAHADGNGGVKAEELQEILSDPALAAGRVREFVAETDEATKQVLEEWTVVARTGLSLSAMALKRLSELCESTGNKEAAQAVAVLMAFQSRIDQSLQGRA